MKANFPIHVQRRYLVTAILLAFIAVYLLYHKKSNLTRVDKDQILNELYLPIKKREKVTFDPNPTRLEMAIRLFEIDNYAGSLQILSTVDPMGSDSLVMSRYVAHSSLNLKDYPNAVKWFERLAHSGDPAYNDEARYHLMMIALIQDDLPRAKKWYRAINDKSFISEGRIKLIKSLW